MLTPKEVNMSRTSDALKRARACYGSTLWGFFFGLAKADRRTLRRRVVRTVVTSDSAGGLCDHPSQPGLEDCGWGVTLETLVVRQNNEDGSAWEVVENYLQQDEKVLTVLRDWSDLDTLTGELDQRLALELKLYRDERDYALKPGQCRTCGVDLRDKPGTRCSVCEEIARRVVEDLDEILEDDEDDDDYDDSFWG
jgi:predicted Zn-ribbon and HTH transcriptional regulator